MQLNTNYNRIQYNYNNWQHNQAPNELTAQFSPVVRFHNGTASPSSLQERAKKYTFSDGSCFFGRYVNGKKEGLGKHIHANGTVFEGHWVAGKRHGYGKMVYADGNRYEGNWANDKKEGFGIFIFASGASYVGDWQNNRHHGKGKYVYADGTYYLGDWIDNARDGHGVSVLSNGAFYDGWWSKGQIQGYGKCLHTNGASYDGYWDHGHPDGQGTYHHASGATYVGNWKLGKKEGHGRYVYLDACYDGNWVYNQPTDTSYSNLGDPGFINPLLGFDMMPLVGYHLGIMASFLYQADCSYKKIAAQLIRAHHFGLAPEQSSQVVYDILTDSRIPSAGKSVLIASGSSKHALGIQFMQESQFPERITVDIFNSGLGLAKYHSQRGKKWQTRLRVEIPLSRITLKVVSTLMKSGFKTIDELYQLVLSLEGNRVVKEPEQTAIYQTAQKGQNCTLEWIFTYLIYELGKAQYDEMRLTLFQACLQKMAENAQSWESAKFQQSIGELQRKITKRQARLANSELITALVLELASSTETIFNNSWF